VGSETADVSLADLRTACGEAEPDRVVVLSDAGVVAAGGAGSVAGRLGVQPIVLTIPSGEPSIESVDAAARQIAEASPSMVVSVGGGSVLDTSKIATALAATGQSAASVLEGRPVPQRPMRLVAVPTTSGSGAEVTRTAVVSQDGRKTWAWGDPLRPDGACLMPELTIGCPPALTLASGLDAIVHAIEAGSSSRVDVTDDRAPSALATALPALRLVMDDPSDIAARRSMQRAASMAGRAIDAHGTGGAHAIGHALSTVHSIPHGFAVGLALAATIEWSMAGAGYRYDDLAESAGGSLPTLVAALLDDLGFVELAGPHMPASIDVAALTEVIGAHENAPMRANNARLIEPSDHRVLAEMTARTWSERLAAS
jgi:alcohol dehydrogenase class IV